MARNNIRYSDKAKVAKRMRRILAALGVFGLLLFGGIYLLNGEPSSDQLDPELELMAETGEQPDPTFQGGLTAEEMAATGDDLLEDETPGLHQGTINPGDTAGADKSPLLICGSLYLLAQFFALPPAQLDE